MPACCPQCHAIARAPRCALCGVAMAQLDELATSRWSGVAVEAKPPPGEGRGAGTMLGTTGLMIGASLLGNALAGTPGALVGFVLGLAPYWGHLWKPRLVRAQRLAALPDPVAPAMPPARRYIGTAQPIDASSPGHTLPSPMTPKRRVVASTTVVRAHGEQATYLCRAASAVPFWLVTPEGKRLLVTGACWVAPTPFASVAEDGARTLGRLGVPTAMAAAGAAGFEARISPGDAVAAIGVAKEETIVGSGSGYRDDVVETLRGEPGAPVWLERL